MKGYLIQWLGAYWDLVILLQSIFLVPGFIIFVIIIARILKRHPYRVLLVPAMQIAKEIVTIIGVIVSVILIDLYDCLFTQLTDNGYVVMIIDAIVGEAISFPLFIKWAKLLSNNRDAE